MGANHIIGSTGSGKSTTIDLLMGLLQPQRKDPFMANICMMWGTQASDGLALHHRHAPKHS